MNWGTPIFLAIIAGFDLAFTRACFAHDAGLAFGSLITTAAGELVILAWRHRRSA